MERIIINEIDATSNEVVTASTDIVYIPGFASNGATAPVRTPILCSSVSEFNKLFGESAPTFWLPQYYPEYKEAAVVGGAGTEGFLADAIPRTASINEDTKIQWFSAGEQDPSYIYAKELLTKGISVLYERINEYTVAPIEPASSYKGEFSTEKEYAIGDICLYNKAYYKAKEAIQAGSWNENKWEKLAPYDVTVENMYQNLTGTKTIHSVYETYSADSDFTGIYEIGAYDVKYITSGGYPTFEYRYFEEGSTAGQYTKLDLEKKIANLAAARGDAIAFIDHTDNPNRKLIGAGSVFQSCKDNLLDATAATFATMITPYAVYTLASNSKVISLPGSFGYFMALAQTIKLYSTWLPMSGVTRGAIGSIVNLNTNKVLTNSIANAYQGDPDSTDGISINAITYIRNYGYCIWGNRTLLNRTSAKPFATMFLNMRGLVCDVKKKVLTTAQKYLFEQNTDILWLNFKSEISTLLEQMKSGSILTNYKIIKLTTNSKTKINAKIQLYPVYAVESFEVSIVLTDDELTVE